MTTSTMNERAFNLVKGELSRMRQSPLASMSAEPNQEEIDTLFGERITPEIELPPMQPLFRMSGIPCFYRGELVADCGKAKSGKTTFLSLLMASALSPDRRELTDDVSKRLALERYVADEGQSDDQPLRVLWIDTEQSQQSTQEILTQRIIPMVRGDTGTDDTRNAENECLNNFFYAFNLRGMGYELRRKMVGVAVKTVKPDLCIIDGIKDLMTDINDAVQATLIMEQLMSLAEARNCCIVCVLHQNKSEADRNMRGSIGTELTNKAFEVFQCEYLERHEVFKVSQTLSRRQRMKTDFYYRLSEKGLPEPCDQPQEQPRDAWGRWMKTNTKPEDLQKLFNEAFEGRTQRKFNELMAVAMKKCGVADAKTYYVLVAEAEEQGIIRKGIHPDTKETWVELTEYGTLPF